MPAESLRSLRVPAVSGLIALIAVFCPWERASAQIPQPLPPVVTADGRLGLCDVLPGSPTATSPPWAQAAYDAGARVNRWEFRWDRIEPKRKVWDFSQDDKVVASSLTAGLSVDGVLDGTPQWATPKGLTRGNSPSKGFRLAVGDPRNLWADWVRGLVAHYRGQVKYWEVWNEPDLSFYWSTTASDYYRMLKVAYTVIKQTDPGAKVIIAGMVAPDMAFFTDVLRLGHADHSHPFDIAAWHAYGPARLLYTNLLKFQGILAGTGYGGTPVWVTEDGFPASNPNGAPRQAAYVLQTIAYALAAGARKILVYRASDDPSGKEWGITSSSGSPRMSYLAFQVAARYITHASSVVYAPTPRLQRFVFYEPDERVTLAWTTGLKDQAFAPSASEPTASTVDWQGNLSSVAARGTNFHLVAPGAGYNTGIDSPGQVVGGPPIFLLDTNSEPADLSPSTLVNPVPGSQRRFVMFNPGDAPLTAVVSAAENALRFESIQVAPHNLGVVDLDLLAGPAYAGAYNVSSTGTLASETVSSNWTGSSPAPSARWYLPLVSGSVMFSNPGSSSSTALVAGYDKRGRVQGQAQVVLKAGQTVGWEASWLETRRKLTLEVSASSPIYVAPSSNNPLAPVSRTQPDWFAVRPGIANLALYNPSSVDEHVNANFIQSQTVNGEQLSLRPHQTFLLPTHSSGVVAIAADNPVAVSSNPTKSAPAQPQKQDSLALAGRTSKIRLFNPASEDAHVAISVISNKGTQQVKAVLKPLQLKSLETRSVSAPPAGVQISSDVPVVATPSS